MPSGRIKHWNIADFLEAEKEDVQRAAILREAALDVERKYQAACQALRVPSLEPRPRKHWFMWFVGNADPSPKQ